MRVLISSVGTRGDVQPAFALALALRAQGAGVRMCVPPNFVARAAELGFDARSLGVEMRAPRAGAPSAVIPDLIRDQFDVLDAAAEGCDLVVGAGAHQYAARSVAELRGLGCVVAVYAPVSLPSRDLGPPGAPLADASPEAIASAWREARDTWNQRALARMNEHRARLGLGAVDDVLGHILSDRPWLAADATLGPAPAETDAAVVQTGAWILDDPSPLPPELERFLDAGDAPVYLGLGSMPAPEGTGRLLVEAARAVGRRAILSRGWAGFALDAPASDCLVVDDVNHQRLFARVAAVVHHGGAGTTTAAARAGAPQVTVPMFSDQFYWGRRVTALGVGASVAHAGLGAGALAEALRAALDPSAGQRARSLASRVSADGAAVAARRLCEGGAGSEGG